MLLANNLIVSSFHKCFLVLCVICIRRSVIGWCVCVPSEAETMTEVYDGKQLQHLKTGVGWKERMEKSNFGSSHVHHVISLWWWNITGLYTGTFMNKLSEHSLLYLFTEKWWSRPTTRNPVRQLKTHLQKSDFNFLFTYLLTTIQLFRVSEIFFFFLN